MRKITLNSRSSEFSQSNVDPHIAINTDYISVNSPYQDIFWLFHAGMT